MSRPLGGEEQHCLLSDLDKRPGGGDDLNDVLQGRRHPNENDDNAGMI